MGARKTQHKRNLVGGGRPSTTTKAKVLEDIVAAMHGLDGFNIEKRAHLPTLDGSGRTREIDVLLTIEPGGYPIRLAVECKNYATKVGIERIDEFIGKLDDVGIPRSLGIFVSAVGYKRGVAERARSVGIRPLVLTGLTKDRLAAEVVTAVQAVIFLLLTVIQVEIHNNVSEAADPSQMLAFYNTEGQLCGIVGDLIWQKWIEGIPESTLGQHVVELSAPADWHQRINGKLEPVPKMLATVSVSAVVLTIKGQATQHGLVDAVEGSPQKVSVNATFPEPEPVLPVHVFDTEDEMAAWLKNQGRVYLTIHRLRLPRIATGPIYWPPSERALRALLQRLEQHEAGVSDDPRLDEVEGTDLNRVFEAIWSGHPAAKQGWAEPRSTASPPLTAEDRTAVAYRNQQQS